MKMEKRLENISVMLSASVPDELMSSLHAQDLFTVIILFTQHILSEGGSLVFGGHPTITPLVHKTASSIMHDQSAIHLHQIRYFRDKAPKETFDDTVFPDIQWFGDESREPDVDDFAEMRDAMSDMSQAAIFVGGKTSGSYGDKPGIRDEYERFLSKNPKGPVYLVGLMEGESKSIINELEQQGKREPNGLTDNQLKLIHSGLNIDLIAPVIIADIGKNVTAPH